MPRFSVLIVIALGLGGCSAIGQYFPDYEPTHQMAASSSSSSSSGMTSAAPPSVGSQAPVTGSVRAPNLDTTALAACRGHVLVPAIGMTFVPSGARIPPAGQYLREESLTPPYRVLPPGTAATMDYVANRLNIEVDRANRILTLRCG